MSTTPTPTPTTPTTPTPEQQVVQQATTGQEPQKYEYTMADGTRFEADSPAKLMEMVGNRYDHLWQQNKKVETENKEFRQNLANLVNPQPTNGFDQKHYYELWAQDPIKAQTYANQFDPNYQQAVSQLEQMQWNAAAQNFRVANPDFSVNDENIAKLNTLCSQLYPNARVLTAEQMGAAHAFAKNIKLYEVQPVTQNTPPPPPPNPSSPQQQAVDPLTLTQEQLRQYIEEQAQKQGQ